MAKQEFISVKDYQNLSEWIDATANCISKILTENNEFSTSQVNLSRVSRSTSSSMTIYDRCDSIRYKGEDVAWIVISQSKDATNSNWMKTVLREDSIQITLILKKEYKNTSTENGWVVPHRYSDNVAGINENALIAQRYIVNLIQKQTGAYTSRDEFAIKYVVSRQGKINITKFKEIIETLKHTISDKHYVDGLDNFLNLSEFNHASVFADADFGHYKLSMNNNNFGLKEEGKLNKTVHSTVVYKSDNNHYVTLKSQGSFKFNVETNMYSDIGYEVTHTINGKSLTNSFNVLDVIKNFNSYIKQFNDSNTGFVITCKNDIVVNSMNDIVAKCLAQNTKYPIIIGDDFEFSHDKDNKTGFSDGMISFTDKLFGEKHYCYVPTLELRFWIKSVYNQDTKNNYTIEDVEKMVNLVKQIIEETSPLM